eukprot:gene770-1473_t
MVDELQGSCEVAVDILNDLLVYEGLEQQNMHLEMKSIPFLSFLTKKLSKLKYQARQKGVTIELILPQGLVYGHQLKDVRIDGEEDKLGQVIRNLVCNGIECSAPGSSVCITVEVKKQRARMQLLLGGSSLIRSKYVLEVHVKDSGPGISQEEQETIFRNALNFSAGVLQARDGHGLGIWISHRIIGLHHGDLTIHSDGLGQGSTFLISLPLHLTATVTPSRDIGISIGIIGVSSPSLSTRSLHMPNFSRDAAINPMTTTDTFVTESNTKNRIGNNDKIVKYSEISGTWDLFRIIIAFKKKSCLFNFRNK